MIRALSTAATGMEAQQTRLDVTANNIANVSTHGFKKSRAEFADLMYQTQRSPGAATGAGTQSPTGLQVGLGVRTTATHRMHGQGDLRQTDNPLDVAIEGRGFYQVNLPSGEVAYTRDGAFKLDPEGQLVTAQGYPLASAISIPPDAQSVTIGADGTVSVTVPGEAAAVEAGQIEVATFANESGLESMGRNLYRETSASGTAVTGPAGENGSGTLAQGTLELSNVNVVEEMIDLITGQRAYEINSRVVKAADEMLAETAQLR
ncbi:MAG TPA: flagellar basal-body rod protein FlgG [Kofleriaceae bacterium]|nr:flagellar basal-body rod protein FlgG [Kofleriaceae bacterium]